MTDLLEMPVRYSAILEDEYDDIDGGAVPVLAIITGVGIIAGGVYASGRVAGERSYYAGLRNPEYQRNKWGYRAGAVALFGSAGALFMVGFENKFYSMI